MLKLLQENHQRVEIQLFANFLNLDVALNPIQKIFLGGKSWILTHF